MQAWVLPSTRKPSNCSGPRLASSYNQVSCPSGKEKFRASVDMRNEEVHAGMLLVDQGAAGPTASV
eukprot:CAMPEP_0172745366 /NCGR_PEP_ID=MMETSP1074-20121228/137718_1 /TAXON_ID=2916 /ORGANISM="Ceratium fusus, Strain PA161109" /LENGTH=65 /DNA_ID=CAMNT_0013576517 /DNA_START=137 /DNA_END=331 /DNA_ORIENTATION=-